MSNEAQLDAQYDLSSIIPTGVAPEQETTSPEPTTPPTVEPGAPSVEEPKPLTQDDLRKALEGIKPEPKAPAAPEPKQYTQEEINAYLKRPNITSELVAGLLGADAADISPERIKAFDDFMMSYAEHAYQRAFVMLEHRFGQIEPDIQSYRTSQIEQQRTTWFNEFYAANPALEPYKEVIASTLLPAIKTQHENSPDVPTDPKALATWVAGKLEAAIRAIQPSFSLKQQPKPKPTTPTQAPQAKPKAAPPPSSPDSSHDFNAIFGIKPKS